MLKNRQTGKHAQKKPAREKPAREKRVLPIGARKSASRAERAGRTKRGKGGKRTKHVKDAKSTLEVLRAADTAPVEKGAGVAALFDAADAPSVDGAAACLIAADELVSENAGAEPGAACGSDAVDGASVDAGTAAASPGDASAAADGELDVSDSFAADSDDVFAALDGALDKADAPAPGTATDDDRNGSADDAGLAPSAADGPAVVDGPSDVDGTDAAAAADADGPAAAAADDADDPAAAAARTVPAAMASIATIDMSGSSRRDGAFASSAIGARPSAAGAQPAQPAGFAEPADFPFASLDAAPLLADAPASDGQAAAKGKGFLSGMPATKKAGTICGLLFALLIILYTAGVVLFSNHQFPRSNIGDSDISFMTVDKLEQTLSGKAENYELLVHNSDFSLTLKGDEVGFEFDAPAVAQSICNQVNAFAWPVELFRVHDYSRHMVASFDEEAVNGKVLEALEAHNEGATDPVNARIGYNEQSGKVEVFPEQYGTKIDPDACLDAVRVAVGSVTRNLVLSQNELLHPPLLRDDAVLKKAAEQCNGITKAHLTIELAGVEIGEVGLCSTPEWVDIAEDGTVTYSEDKRNEWIYDYCLSLSTVGSERTYTRADGKEITVSGGTYGWEIDADSLYGEIVSGIEANETKTIEAPCSGEAEVFAGVGKRDWGNRYIDIDLAEQHVYYYDENGECVWDADCISGKPDGVHDTTPGVYVINLKASPQTLYGYENGVKIYESHVTYWMPFVGNAIGLHDATWQPGFGGTMYRGGYGSHGCVNLSYSSAQSLYSLIEPGVVVSCHW